MVDGCLDSLRERLVARDDTALSTLVDRRFVSLVRIALIYLGERGEAFDVVRGIERAAAEDALSMPPAESAERWLLRLLLDRLRASAIESGAPATTSPDPRTAVAPGRYTLEGAWAMPPVTGAHLPENVDPSELQDLIGEVISALPLDQREVVILRDVERWSVEEISAFGGRTPTEVRRLLDRARSCILGATEHELRQRATPTVAIV